MNRHLTWPALALALAACGGGGGETPPSEADEPQEVAWELLPMPEELHQVPDELSRPDRAYMVWQHGNFWRVAR